MSGILTLLYLSVYFTPVWASSVIPVILIPGNGGCQLEAKLQNKPRVPHWWCKKNSDWFRLWFDFKQLLPYQIDCWGDNMRLVYSDKNGGSYSDAPGVLVRAPGWGATNTLEYLDPYFRAGGSNMFGTLVDFLIRNGGKRGETVRGAPYDFRKVPSSEYFDKLKKLVEETKWENNGLPVNIVSHSLGGLVVARFLRSMSRSWRETNLRRWIAVATPFAGSEGIIQSFASGNNLGVTAVDPNAIRSVQRSSETNFWLLPSVEKYGDTVIASTGVRNYTARDYRSFFSDIGFPEGFAQFQRVERLYSIQDSAGELVSGINLTHCYGLGVDTPSSLVYDADDFSAGPETTFTADGDGTVGIESLQAFESSWLKSGRFERRIYPGVSHVGILQNEQFLSELVELLGWEPLQQVSRGRGSNPSRMESIPYR
uniref:Lysophospholipase III n=1 Tax=Tetraselmis sp. GSL018 TaxID=582737 RepID=A0A061RML1_9CHLO